MIKRVFTIGYATKPIDIFIQQLKDYSVNAVADVRSVPYSKAFFDYHRENITSHLAKNGIRYVYLGDELGPRSKDDNHYNENGQVQFDKLMEAKIFKQGIERVNQGVERGFNIALMCAEKDPATCHRSLLIGYYLLRNNLTDITIDHITHDGQLETQQDLENRLTQIHQTGTDLFMDECESKKQAYESQLKKTSYIKPLD
ncbi:DUF488 family protein [Aliikangiella coralliicola]|uniref:DUF488 domain-containing protein n=1 Tax=Aliikangiella coralliicola TaxID=2592383 RepID=A0A545UFT6_9GAMM|nr:DUF488 domain-containing protein [Aliikangiella coralliicola]TQV88329.1 DUF488 domain-containing protein [Aliikangiella coralliicola]